MKRLLIFSAFLSLGFTSSGQGNKIALIEVVEVLNNNITEVTYYYQNNWLTYRKAMLKKGFIHSYKLMKVPPDSSNSSVRFVLETVYSDSAQWLLAEPRWQQTIKEINPNGPRLLNEKKPAEFRKNIFSVTSEILSEDKPGKKRKQYVQLKR